MIFSIDTEEPSAEAGLITGVNLIYRVTWMGIRAGKGIIQIGNVTKGDELEYLPVSISVRTSGFARLLFKIDDHMSSMLHPEKLFPYRFEETIQEDSYRRERVIEFDHDKRTGRVFRREEGKLILDKEVPIEDDFHDFLSWTFFLMTQELKIGHIFRFMVLTYGAIDETFIEVKRRKRISLSRLGKFQAFQLVPTGETRKSIKKRGGTAEVWVDSRKRIPIKMTIKIPKAGSIKLRLIKIEKK